MKNLQAYYYLILILFSISGICYSQQSAIDSINALNEKYGPQDPIIDAVKTHVYKVKVINTCSIRKNQCYSGTTGSATLVKIIEGEYANRYLLVATYCFETEYKADKDYYLYASSSPNLSFYLCNGSLYAPDWNYHIKENGHPLVFGELRKK